MPKYKKPILIAVVLLNILGLIVNPLIIQDANIKEPIKLMSVIFSGMLLLIYAILSKNEPKKKTTLFQIFGIIAYGLILYALLKFL